MIATISATGAPPQAFACRIKKLFALSAIVLLAGCQAIPRGGNAPPVAGPAPVDTVHRVALLLPMTGPDGDVGVSIANATALALTDTNATNIRLSTYDTSASVTAATNRAVADGNKLILGPLRGDQVIEVASIARPRNIPILSFSNDVGVAGRNVFLLGHLPNQSIDRSVRYAKARGLLRFGAIVPRNIYGQRASASLAQSARSAGVTLVGVQEADGSVASVDAATKKLATMGSMDAVFVADSGRASLVIVPSLRRNGFRAARVIGTDLWNIDSSLASNSVMYRAWFSSVSDTLYNQYAGKYRARFGKSPLRLSSLGYDSILLVARISRGGWRTGTAFPIAQLTDPQGFIGVDGAFRFMPNGLTERMLEVQEIQAGKFVTIDAAPGAFPK
jgi:ABC-type branched-subunit amino acid transport system substrate-binding protein